MMAGTSVFPQTEVTPLADGVVSGNDELSEARMSVLPGGRPEMALGNWGEQASSWPETPAIAIHRSNTISVGKFIILRILSVLEK